MKKAQTKKVTKVAPTIRVVKSTYYSNWGDRIGYPLASLIVKPLSRISFLTPNHVTLISFVSFALGCLFLVLQFPYHLIIGGIMIFLGYSQNLSSNVLHRICCLSPDRKCALYSAWIYCLFYVPISLLHKTRNDV